MERASGEVPATIRRVRECATDTAQIKLNLPRALAARAAWWRWYARRRGDRPWRKG